MNSAVKTSLGRISLCASASGACGAPYLKGVCGVARLEPEWCSSLGVLQVCALQRPGLVGRPTLRGSVG
ncbi:hypothetical protein CHLRE_14g626576v5 [Chlamydomonas reinhardtii]|uniref:Uncharacterized protein n=1 Tax=Chlamydomonas reinhardtii TaxID=3055 RepID=A0A2K3CYF2_CHLRE|nr:uncharacterized protein CHLRE_14g626576v5 [Chlamydomonas reinhardtii]PNW73289.1 hypothetical protein CHLRE_14g626576v5 [Chlamydomonas reinhardtii]